MEELYQDFEMGLATKLRHNLRAWHPKPYQPAMAGHASGCGNNYDEKRRVVKKLFGQKMKRKRVIQS